MAWNYPEGYPQNREEAIALAMSIREEDIDYSDIPPIRITEHTKIERVGDRFRKAGERNLAHLNQMLRDYDEVKKILARERQKESDSKKQD